MSQRMCNVRRLETRICQTVSAWRFSQIRADRIQQLRPEWWWYRQLQRSSRSYDINHQWQRGPEAFLDIRVSLFWIFEWVSSSMFLLIIIFLTNLEKIVQTVEQYFIKRFNYLIEIGKYKLSFWINSSDLLLIRFYDLNGDGCITRQEMLAIVSAIYEMMQNTQIQSVVNKQVDRFFEKMDTNRDGIVSREEFMSNCKNVWEYPII